MRFCRLLGVFAVLVIMVSAGPLSARASGGTTIGPVPISVLGHPRLCWQAGGNGSAVTLEHCDRMLQGQRWSLTPDGVLMNGNGYCLEAPDPNPVSRRSLPMRHTLPSRPVDRCREHLGCPSFGVDVPLGSFFDVRCAIDSESGSPATTGRWEDGSS